jgi:hypothetical protein
MYAGADAASAATLGGGASVNGGMALGGGFGGATSGLGSGVSDFGLGNVADAGITNSPFTPASVQAPLPMDGSYLQSLGQYTPGSSGMMTLPNVTGGASLPTSNMGGPPSAPSSGAPGTPPPANPNMPSTPSGLESMFPNGAPSWLGPAITAAGGLLGSQGNESSQSQTQKLDPRLDGAFYNNLLPQAQSVFDMTLPQSVNQGAQMNAVGSGLLGRPIAGNGVGQVQMGAVNEASNPYLTGRADDMQRRTKELLDGNNLAIQGNAVGAGGLGGSRQGVAQGIAAGKAADYLQGNLANMYSTAYEGDSNRALSKYGIDINNYATQRGQDMQGATIGAGLLAQGQQMPWNALNNMGGLLNQFKTTNTTNTQNSGGGMQGALGGLLGGAQFAQNMGLFGGGSNTSGGWW